VGIDKSRLAKLFEPFWTQLEEHGDGTGLGLSIVNELCEKMLGSMNVASAPGQGSTFSFTVSMEETDPIHWQEHQDEIPDLSSLNLKILVVDDNEIHRDVMDAMLSRLNLSADFAVDGFDAVHKVANANENYDIVFMDIVMPSMSGIDATKRIRSLNAGQLTSITACTGNASANDKSQCYQAGMNSFMAKPITLDTLVENLQSTPKILASYH
jgi:CheY-like chemotaxis protein